MASTPTLSATSPPHLYHPCYCCLLHRADAQLTHTLDPNLLLHHRSFLLSSSAVASSLLSPSSSAKTAHPAGQPQPAVITDRVFFDFGFCPSYLRSDRPLSLDLASCPDAKSIGRIVFGLYGKLLPHTIGNFKTACATTAYRGTLVHKILQCQFFLASRQEKKEKGEVRPPPGLVPNMETIDPKSFQLKHSRPGTLSLSLSENDNDEAIKLEPEYHLFEFLVTVGLGLCPELDNKNIVFGWARIVPGA